MLSVKHTILTAGSSKLMTTSGIPCAKLLLQFSACITHQRVVFRQQAQQHCTSSVVAHMCNSIRQFGTSVAAFDLLWTARAVGDAFGNTRLSRSLYLASTAARSISTFLSRLFMSMSRLRASMLRSYTLNAKSVVRKQERGVKPASIERGLCFHFTFSRARNLA